jgi:hypothetical protein
VLFFQASKIEVGKNIAQQNKPAILIFLENAQRLASAAHVRAEMQIREDQRVDLRSDDLRRHAFIVVKECYEVMNWESMKSPEVTGQ